MEFIDSGNLDAQVVVMRRRLLALAWMMPPLIFPRSLQVSRTLRAMSERGWNSTVFTVPLDVEPFAAQDPQLEQFYRGSYEIKYVEPREEVESSPLWLRIARRIAHAKNIRDLNWIRRASRALCQQIEVERPDALVSFAQPWINHQVGLRVKRRYPQLPWIAHFSDPWVDSPYFHPPDEKTRALAVVQEREIISAADVLIFTTQDTVDLVMAKYPDAWARKVHVVSHGYDADLLDLILPRPKSSKFKIIHTGNLYEKREPLALLRALATLRAEQPSAGIQVEFVGYTAKTMHDMVKHLDLGDMVSIAPNVPFLESLAIGQSADLLLVIDAPTERSVFLPSKIVDYLSLRRPVLALTPQTGASARVLGNLGFPIVDPTDETGLLDVLRESLARWQRGGNATNVPLQEEIQKYSIREVVVGFEAAIVSAILDQEDKNA
jgi:glycosyltransferase involved in cell wall biosynthesis